MPTDKWGIPFIYPTGGRGYFHQQKDNALDDDGWIRFGKEIDDIEIIDEDTGEWQFPFLDDGDGLSMSGGTGHHSGGENHGCQGFAYMIDNTWDENPAKWRFRKEMYHVHYINDPQHGTWTHPAVNFQIAGHGWFGQKWIRYNKKDGRGTGKDSVVLEVWVCTNPDDDIEKWVMLKRREDKGGWGDGGDSCGGEDDQVGTWGAIQFRFKSSASDFSLHPIIPETNDSPVVHCIGKEDMDFADTEARGYCKDERIPRDIEMTCLYKKDSPSNGLCRFKNISLREIDPSKDFDSDPDDPGTTPPVDQPTKTQIIKGAFTLMYDINQQRSNPCSATGDKAFFEWMTPADEQSIGNNIPADGAKRWGERVSNNNSSLHGKKPSKLDVKLAKVGTPAATPTIKATIRNASLALIYTSPTEIDPTTLTGSLATRTFDFSTNTYEMQIGDRILVEHENTDSSNYCVIGVRPNDNMTEADGTNSTLTYFDGNWHNSASRDLACIIYEA